MHEKENSKRGAYLSGRRKRRKLTLAGEKEGTAEEGGETFLPNGGKILSFISTNEKKRGVG